MIMNQAVRPAAVAGLFYTQDPEELRRQVMSFVAEGRGEAKRSRALVVPHAGYQYSGAVAGSAFRCLSQQASDIHRVYLFGPAHRVYTEGVATVSVDAFSTPLGDVPVDQAALAELRHAFDELAVSDASHAMEHSLEVQLPFLQCVLNAFSLVPLVVGDIAPERLSGLMEHALLDREGLVVVSTDLSHYLSYADARIVDGQTIDHVQKLDWQALDGGRACGYVALSALLICAQRHGWEARALDVRNSGDTAGPRDRVVGYAALALVE